MSGAAKKCRPERQAGVAAPAHRENVKNLTGRKRGKQLAPRRGLQRQRFESLKRRVIYGRGAIDWEEKNGVPKRIRTSGLPLRRGTLYPAELPGRGPEF